MRRRLELDTRTVALPKGTRVALLADVPARDGWLCRRGTAGRIIEADHPRYVVTTPSGHTLEVRRAQLAVAQERLAEVSAERAWAWETFASTVALEVVVGSRAWGLDEEGSDEDVRGAFLLPFDAHVGLWTPPDELQPPGQEAQLWEVEKLIRHALRADANVLEALWTPLVRFADDVGELLRARRHLFLSRRVHGSFGRYALGQLEKLRRGLELRDAEARLTAWLADDPALPAAVAAARLEADGLAPPGGGGAWVGRVARALHDRGVTPSRAYEDAAAALAAAHPEPAPWRPKNAYNLLRLLHSGVHLATTGEPMIRVEDPAIRARLLAIKRGEADLGGVIAEARDLAAAFDTAIATSPLPEEPDLDGADALLRTCRAVAARRRFRLPARAPADVAPWPRPAPRFAVPDALARAWVGRVAAGRDVVLCAVSGAHAYGFPSPDSDVDLKGTWMAPAADVLGPGPAPAGVGRVEIVDGVELDLTLDEAGRTVSLLVRGNGNVLERLASPWQVLPVPGADAAADRRLEELRHLALSGVHQGVHAHYRGFLRRKRRDVAATPTVKGWLYAYRVGLTGVHLLRTGEVVQDLEVLLPSALAHVRELTAAKRTGDAHAAVELVARLAPRVTRDLDALEAALDEAGATSPLPPSCPNEPALAAGLATWRTGG